MPDRICRWCGVLLTDENSRHHRRRCKKCESAHRKLKLRGSLHHRAIEMLASARRRARKCGAEFSITAELVEGLLQSGRCAISGIPLDLEPPENLEPGPRNPIAPSLDRIDPDRGYVPGNVRIVCVAINSAMGCWGEEVTKAIMQEWIRGGS